MSAVSMIDLPDDYGIRRCRSHWHVTHHGEDVGPEYETAAYALSAAVLMSGARKDGTVVRYVPSQVETDARRYRIVKAQWHNIAAASQNDERWLNKDTLDEAVDALGAEGAA